MKSAELIKYVVPKRTISKLEKPVVKLWGIYTRGTDGIPRVIENIACIFDRDDAIKFADELNGRIPGGHEVFRPALVFIYGPKPSKKTTKKARK